MCAELGEFGIEVCYNFVRIHTLCEHPRVPPLEKYVENHPSDVLMMHRPAHEIGRLCQTNQHGEPTHALLHRNDIKTWPDGKKNVAAKITALRIAAEFAVKSLGRSKPLRVPNAAENRAYASVNKDATPSREAADPDRGTVYRFEY